MPGTTNYPTTLDSHTGADPFGFHEAINLAETALNGAITNSDTTITVTSTSVFPSRGTLVVESEVITYTGKTGTTFTGCVRGTGGTTAAAHADTVKVRQDPVAANHNDLAAAIVALETQLGIQAWTTFTPTLTQGVSLSPTITYAEYKLIGKLAIVQFHLAITAAGTGGSKLSLESWPAAIAPLRTGQWRCIGSAIYVDAGTAIYNLAVSPNTSTILRFSGYNAADEFGTSPAVTAASGDSISGSLAYQVA